jgi:hypothetical protein
MRQDARITLPQSFFLLPGGEGQEDAPHRRKIERRQPVMGKLAFMGDAQDVGAEIGNTIASAASASPQSAYSIRPGDSTPARAATSRP